jgi:hypothetical protein
MITFTYSSCQYFQRYRFHDSGLEYVKAVYPEDILWKVWLEEPVSRRKERTSNVEFRLHKEENVV